MNQPEEIARSLLNWLKRANLFPATDINTVKKKIETKIALLSQIGFDDFKTKVDTAQRLEVQDIAEGYLYLTSYYLQKEANTKAVTCLTKVTQMLEILPAIEGDIPKINLILRHSLLLALQIADTPSKMVTILLNHSKEYQSPGVEKYPVILYHLVLTLAYLKTGDLASFYNRSNMLRELVMRTLRTKLTSTAEDFAVSQIISLKALRGENLNRQVFSGAVVLSLVFQIMNDANSGKSSAQTGRQLDIAAKMSSQMDKPFQAILASFFQQAETQLAELNISDAPQLNEKSYTVRVNAYEAPLTKLKFSSKLKKKSGPWDADKASLFLTTTESSQQFPKAGIFVPKLYEVDPAVLEAQFAKFKKSTSAVRADFLSESKNKVTTEPTCRLRFDTERSIGSLHNLKNAHRDFHSQKQSLTFGDELTREKSANEGSRPPGFEWSKNSHTKGLMSARQFSYRKKVVVENSAKTLNEKESTKNTQTQRAENLSFHLRSHSRYLTDIGKSRKPSMSENCELRLSAKSCSQDRAVNEIAVGPGKITIAHRPMKSELFNALPRKSIGSPRAASRIIFSSLDNALSSRPTYQNRQTEHIFENKSAKESQVLFQSGASNSYQLKLDQLKGIYGKKPNHKKTLSVAAAKMAVRDDQSYHEGPTLELDLGQINDSQHKQLESEAPVIGGQAVEHSKSPMLDLSKTKKMRSASITTINKVSGKEFDKQSTGKRRVTTNLALSNSIFAPRKSERISKFSSNSLKRTSTLEVTSPGKKEGNQNMVTFNKLNVSYNPDRPIIESKQELLEIEENRRDLRLGDSIQSEQEGRSSSNKAHGSKRLQRRTSTLKIAEKKGTESEFDENTVKTPNQLTPRGKPSQAYDFGRAQKSGSDRESICDPKKHSPHGKPKHADDDQPKSSRQLSESQVKKTVYKTIGHLIPKSEQQLSGKESSGNKDDASASKFKAHRLKNAEAYELLEQLEYNSSSSQNKEDEKQDDSKNEPEDNYKMFNVQNFTLLRLVKGAEKLNRFDLIRKERQTRMAFFVLHFCSLRFRGNRPKPDNNATMIDLSPFQIDILNGGQKPNTRR